MRPIRSWNDFSSRGPLNLLVDTHILLWSLAEPEKLTQPCRVALTDPENQIWVSAVSVWEIVIKAQRGKLQIPNDWAAGIKAQDFQVLSFEARHALAVSGLPLHHQDPFDRALLAQARSENLRLVTADADMKRYRSEIDLLEC